MDSFFSSYHGLSPRQHFPDHQVPNNLGHTMLFVFFVTFFKHLGKLLHIYPFFCFMTVTSPLYLPKEHELFEGKDPVCLAHLSMYSWT